MKLRSGVVSVGLVVACLAVAGSATAASPGVGTSVIGGQPVSTSQFPFMARIVAREGFIVSLCSGTVASANMVLTAAHCLLDESGAAFHPPASFEVLTGTGSLAVPGVVSRAERVVIDPNYVSSGSFGGWHDAGLIQLTAPIAAPPVKLATSQIWGPGTGGYIVGWGVTEPNGSPPSELQAGETVVQSTAYCQSEIGVRFHPLAELCTLDYPSYESATCNGDSGGPLLKVSNQELVQIGITSFGPEGCPTTAPRVDTRVDVVSAWVQREIAAHPPTPASPPAPPPPTRTTPVTRTSPAAAPPAPELPEVTVAQAKHNTFNVLRTDRKLASRFRVHSAYKVSCRSTSRTSASCAVSWYSRPNDYWGGVTIFEELEGTTAVWNYRYTIRAVNDYCYWQSGHRRRCPVRFIRG